MKTIVGIILAVVGAAVVLWGVFDALLPLMNYYKANVENAMGVPDGAEQQLSSTMIRAVIKGAVGVPFLIAGSVLLKVSFVQRLRRKRGLSTRR